MKLCIPAHVGNRTVTWAGILIKYLLLKYSKCFIKTLLFCLNTTYTKFYCILYVLLIRIRSKLNRREFIYGNNVDSDFIMCTYYNSFSQTVKYAINLIRQKQRKNYKQVYLHCSQTLQTMQVYLECGKPGSYI